MFKGPQSGFLSNKLVQLGLYDAMFSRQKKHLSTLTDVWHSYFSAFPKYTWVCTLQTKSIQCHGFLILEEKDEWVSWLLAIHEKFTWIQNTHWINKALAWTRRYFKQQILYPKPIHSYASGQHAQTAPDVIIENCVLTTPENNIFQGAPIVTLCSLS